MEEKTMRRAVIAMVTLALGAACTSDTTPRASPPTEVSEDRPELTDCEGLRVPRNREIDTNLNKRDGILEFSYLDRQAHEDVHFRIAYEDPACEENPDTKRLIDHVLGASEATTPLTKEDGIVRAFFILRGAEPYERSAYVGAERPVQNDAAIEERLRIAMEELVKGPTKEERNEKLASTFSDATAGLVRKVAVVDGRARVVFRDFRPIIPQVSTSNGGVAFQFSLNLTVFQFPEIDQVSYSIEGNCARYWKFLQVEVCRPVTRERWERAWN